MRDPDFELKVRALMRSTAKRPVTVDELKSAERARVMRANKAESAALRSFEPQPQQVPDLRPAKNFGGDDLAGDEFTVAVDDGQGPPPPINTAFSGPLQTERGPVATKGKDMSKCVEHAARIANIHAQSDFSEAAKSTAIRAANEQHAPECAGLCNLTGENASKAAVAYDARSETQNVGWFVSTNLPRRK